MKYLFLALFFIQGALASFSQTLKLNDKYSIQLGTEEDILKYGEKGFRWGWVPDTHIGVISRNPLKVVLAAGCSTVYGEGTDMRHLGHFKEVATPDKKWPYANGYMGIGSVYRHTDGRLYGFAHCEDWVGMGYSGWNHFYATIGVLVSDDEGKTWEYLGPCIISAKEKTGNKEHPEASPAQGSGEAYVTLSPDGDYLYCYYTEHSNFQGIGLARRNIKKGGSLTESWEKYNNGWHGDPGKGGTDSPFLGPDFPGPYAPQVIYSEYLQKMVMLIVLGGQDKTGLYLSFSDDGIHWDKPSQIVKFNHWKDMWQPSIIWDDQDGASGSGWIYYGTQVDKGLPQGHYMVGKPFRLLKAGQPVE